MTFWNDPIVEKSNAILLDLKGQFEFTLIGGWAVYLYTRALKSKDIDIIVDHAVLSRMMATMGISKNERLRKYESDAGGVSIDIYLSHYSRLAVPLEDVLMAAVIIDGFRVPPLGMLLAMKQLAELERRASVKGVKDRVDILSILLSGALDIGEYALMLRRYRLDYLERLRTIVLEAQDEFEYLGLKDLREVKKKRRALLEMIDAKRR